MMGDYRTVIFDLDGTLLNTLEDLKDSVNEILKQHGYSERSLSEIRSFVGNGAANLIRRALPEGSSQEEIGNCLKEYSAYYFAHSRIKTCPYEGILNMLKELKARGFCLAVVSNKGEDTVKDLCETYFPGYISAAVGDMEGFQKKPAPDNVWRAMSECHAKRNDTLYVGDSEVDIETAKNCGLDSVLVSWGFREKELLKEHGAQHIIDSPLELLEFLG